jgi:hypothetical protein
MEQSPKQIGTIKSLSHDLVASIAPKETPFFDELFAAYAQEWAKGSGQEPWENLETDSLSFDPGAMAEALLTPTIITAVVLGLSKALELLADMRSGQQEPAQELSIEDIDFPRLEKELFQTLRSRNVRRRRAREIASAFTALVARDPQVVLKTSK